MTSSDTWVPPWNPKRSAAVFIDAANFYPAIKQRLGFNCDYNRLLNFLKDTTDLLRVYYYTAVRSEGHVKIRPLLDYLTFNGYTVVTKPMREFRDDAGEIRSKGNMDSHIIVDMMKLSDKVDHIILFSGDGDFAYTVDHLKSAGVYVTVISTLGDGNSTSMVSEELRRVADAFVDLLEIRPFIETKRPHEDDEPDEDLVTLPRFVTAGMRG